MTLHANGAGTAMTVAITFERAETMELFRRNIDVLAQQLQDEGYRSLSFSFGGQGANDRPAHHGPQPGAAAVPAVHPGADPTPDAPKPVRQIADGRIDIRI